jgi:hypothetical protein
LLVARNIWANSPAHSVTHTLLNLWLARTLPDNANALSTMYQEGVVFLERNMSVDWKTSYRVAMLLLNCLREDIQCLPAEQVVRFLEAIVPHVDEDARGLRNALGIVFTGLSIEMPDDWKVKLGAIGGACADRQRSVEPVEALRTWMMVHQAGIADPTPLVDDPLSFLLSIRLPNELDGHEALIAEVRRIVETRYAGSARVDDVTRHLHRDK